MVPTVKVILWFRRLGNGVGCRRLSVFVFPLRGRENKNLEPPPAYPSKFGSGVGDSSHLPRVVGRLGTGDARYSKNLTSNFRNTKFGIGQGDFSWVWGR